MCLKIRCDGECENFYKIFRELNKAYSVVYLIQRPLAKLASYLQRTHHHHHLTLDSDHRANCLAPKLSPVELQTAGLLALITCGCAVWSRGSSL